MFHRGRSTVAIALCCAVAGAVLAGCDEAEDTGQPQQPSGGGATSAQQAGKDLLTGTKKIDVDGKSVRVSCSGALVAGRPVVVLLAGAGDGLEKFAGIQKTLSAKDKVCSYDRLGEGGSDKPDRPQNYQTTGKVLTAVLDQVAGDNPVVLAGHSLGGNIAGRYTPDHTDRVKGLVLIDATPPTAVADTLKGIPASAKGPAAQLRAQMVQMSKGRNPELLTIADGPVKSAGDIPVEVLKHGPNFLTPIPKWGPTLEQIWTTGTQKWLGLSTNSALRIAQKSTHYIYLDQPDVAVDAIERVATEAAEKG